MADFIHLSCPACGANLVITQDLEQYACSYCGNEYIINRSGGITTQNIVNPRTINPKNAPKKSEIKPPQISVTLENKVFHKANYSAGDGGDRIDFTFIFQSLLERDVRAFKGAVIFKDLFDQEILRVTLTHETGLPKKGTTVWKGGIKYNQFMETHQRLLTVEKSQITVFFDCESIIYADEIISGEILNPLTISPNITHKEFDSKSPKICVSLENKVFHKANYSAGDSGDRIDFTFLFQSLLERDVRAFKGAVIFKDLFDQEILRVTLTHETGLPKKGTALWKGGIQYNQFMETHQRLLTIEKNDITVSFDCDSIIYADGSRESLA